MNKGKDGPKPLVQFLFAVMSGDVVGNCRVFGKKRVVCYLQRRHTSCIVSNIDFLSISGPLSLPFTLDSSLLSFCPKHFIYLQDLTDPFCSLP